MANRSESTFGDVNRIWKLKEEKSELRSHLCPLKEQYDLAVQERDSLKLFLQLISKDLYFQLKKNEKKKSFDTRCATFTFYTFIRITSYTNVFPRSIDVVTVARSTEIFTL